MNVRTVTLGTLLGFLDSEQFTFKYSGTPGAARQAIVNAVGRKDGVGMRSGTFQAKLNDDHVSVCLFTPQTRAWYGPIFDGELRCDPDAVVVLEGRFRMTFVEAISFALIQCGLVAWAVQYVIGSWYSARSYYVLRILVTLALVSAALFVPRLSWLARTWKINAIKSILACQGFS